MTDGFAVLCDVSGNITQILNDTLGYGENILPGMLFTRLAAPGELAKALSFMMEITTQGAAFDWEINIPNGETVKTLHFSGVKMNDSLLIFAAENNKFARELFEGMLHMSNEQTNVLRSALKDKSLIESDASQFDEFSRLNNELVSMQRELAKKNSELELRVQERTADLQNTNSSLARALSSRDEFLAAMSHELRTPMVGVLGLAQVLQLQTYGPLTEKQVNALKNIEDSGQHLLELINNVLDYSRLQSGSLQLEKKLLLVREVCQAALKTANLLADRKGQQISLQIDPPDLSLAADGARLQQILLHLLNNASKFTGKGGRIGIQAARKEGEVFITVWDTGIGIKAEDMPRLFKPFAQLDARLERMYSGTGLGLALAKSLVELHSGRMQVESEPGQGSKFTVILPEK